VCRISQLECCSAGLKDRDVPAFGSKRRPLLQPQYIAVKMKRSVVVCHRHDQAQLMNSVLLHRLIVSFDSMLPVAYAQEADAPTTLFLWQYQPHLCSYAYFPSLFTVICGCRPQRRRCGTT